MQHKLFCFDIAANILVISLISFIVPLKCQMPSQYNSLRMNGVDCKFLEAFLDLHRETSMDDTLSYGKASNTLIFHNTLCLLSNIFLSIKI